MDRSFAAAQKIKVRYNLHGSAGTPVRGVLHNTVHRLPGKQGAHGDHATTP
jgi:hypothetical protein